MGCVTRLRFPFPSAGSRLRPCPYRALPACGTDASAFASARTQRRAAAALAETQQRQNRTAGELLRRRGRPKIGLAASKMSRAAHGAPDELSASSRYEALRPADRPTRVPTHRARGGGDAELRAGNQ